MNANELANYWMNRKFAIEMADETADMLFQQQTEIEEWKRKYKDMHNLATQAMSRVHELEKTNSYAIDTSEQYVDKTQNNRHELTNDEIIEIRQEVWDDNKFISEIFNDFARAILRKAQEK